MVKFTIEYKEKNKKKKADAYLPTKWEDITLSQFIEISNGVGTQFRMLEILTGIDRIIWGKVVTKDIDQKLAPVLSFLSQPKKMNKLKLPIWLDVGNEFNYRVPSDLDLETFGQRALLQEKMVDTVIRQKKNVIEIMPYALALYFQPLMDGEDFNEQRANELVEQMGAINCIDAYPIANFFLKKYSVFAKNTTRTSLANRIARSWRRAWTSLVSSGSSEPSTA